MPRTSANQAVVNNVVNNPTETVEQPVVETVVETVEQSQFEAAVTDNRDLVSSKFLLSLIGLDSEEITNKLVAHKAVTSYDNLKIKNVLVKPGRSGQADNIILVLNTKLPIYVRDRETDEWTLTESSNLFTSRVQLAALAKNEGETVLAKQMATVNEDVLSVILSNARVSFTGYFMPADELYVNPYASRKPDEDRDENYSKHESYRYDLNMITFGSAKNMVAQANKLEAITRLNRLFVSSADGDDDEEYDD